MKLSLLVFTLFAICLLAGCTWGAVSVPTPSANATATAVVQTAIPPTEAGLGRPPATPTLSMQSNERPAATQPATGLPQTPAAVRGIFDRRQENSILVAASLVDQQDQPSTNTSQDGQSGQPSFPTSSDPNQPKVEVVVTSQTIVYNNVTAREPPNGPPPAGIEEIQQVEPGALDELGPLCLITVWGSWTGDRIIADVLVYSFPDMQSPPAP